MPKKPRAKSSPKRGKSAAGRRASPAPRRAKPAKPRIFVGGSSEGRSTLRRVCRWLEEECDATPVRWPDVFQLGDLSLDVILEQSRQVDGAILVATADDMVVSRGRRQPGPRDNVLLELGIFMSALTPQRAALLCVADDRGRFPRLPSDLAGLTTLRLSDGTKNATIDKLEAWIASFRAPRPSSAARELETRTSKRYTWADVTAGVAHMGLLMEADGFVPDVVLGLGRSGGVVGGLLAAHLGSIPLRLLDLTYGRGSRGLTVAVQQIDSQLRLPRGAKRIVVVEGATTGGLTPRRAEEALRRHFPASRYEIKFAILIQCAGSSFHADYTAYVERGALDRLPWHGPLSRTFLTPGAADTD